MIISRGLGTNNLLVSSGYGQFEEVVTELATQELVRRGIKFGNGRKLKYQDEEYDVLISAKVLLINDIEPPEPIKGHVRVSFSNNEFPVVKIVDSESIVLPSEIVINVKKVTSQHGRD